MEIWQIGLFREMVKGMGGAADLVSWEAGLEAWSM